jgi:hypothetical protein
MKSMVWMLVVATFWVGVMQSRIEAALIPSRAPALAVAGSVDQTAADQKTIQTTLESKAIRDRLHALGLSDAEIQYRLSRLSESQKHQLASQIRALNPAGDGIIVGLLVIVVLVLLIIFLAKRI